MSAIEDASSIVPCEKDTSTNVETCEETGTASRYFRRSQDPDWYNKPRVWIEITQEEYGSAFDDG